MTFEPELFYKIPEISMEVTVNGSEIIQFRRYIQPDLDESYIRFAIESFEHELLNHIKKHKESK